MMKIKNIISFNLLIISAVFNTACSDQFLVDKKNFENVNTEIYDYYSGAKGRVDDIYSWILPNVANVAWNNNSTGMADMDAKSTEEYSGFSQPSYVNPLAPLVTNTNDHTTVPDYFQYQTNIQVSVWGRIRNCNEAIHGIMNGSLSQDEKDELVGQLYFLRAWAYYNLVKYYGGVPIIKKAQDPVAGDDLTIPRSSAKECIDFICEDLYAAAIMLPEKWDGENYGRITKGAAWAMIGRVRLLHASPLFNRADDTGRWEIAYQDNKKAIDTLTYNGIYGLAYLNDPGINASNWAKMFNEVGTQNVEAIFLTLYNSEPTISGTNFNKNNNWEHDIRPSNALGGGGKTPSSMLVDIFPMKDGKRPTDIQTYILLSASDYTPTQPFLNRDPRFYRTFAFPGVRWAFNGDPRSDKNNYTQDGTEFELWNYVWYASVKDRDNTDTGSDKTYGADGLLKNAKGFYVRKRSDDLDVNTNTRYVYETEDGNNAFKRNANPYIEIRFAEALLNFAEAACGAGHLSEAVAALKQIRQRVGYTGDCGLDADLESNRAKLFSAILYERQIELAYEGKRYDDMRRWMLFDGGAEKAEGAPTTWTLSGFSGNTCTYLGFKKFNGQRRDNMEFRVSNNFNNGIGEGTVNGDPLLNVARPNALDLRKDISTQQDALMTFYNTYLVRKKKKGDDYSSDNAELYISYLPKYYFLGFKQGVQGSNKELKQTIGWDDYINGGNGTFDPLAE